MSLKAPLLLTSTGNNFASTIYWSNIHIVHETSFERSRNPRRWHHDRKGNPHALLSRLSTASFISLTMHFNIEIYRGRLSICVYQSTKPGHEMELTRRPKSFICRLIKVTAIKRQLSLSGSPALALIAILRAKKSPMLHDGEGRTEDDSIDSNYLDLLHEFGAFLISVHFTVLRLWHNCRARS